MRTCLPSAIAAGWLLLAAASPGGAAIFHLNRNSPIRQSSGVTLRKRLHVNDLIAEPGTVEIDFGGLDSFTTDMFTLPTAIKWTPDGDFLLWGRTEYSVSFDSVSSAAIAAGRTTQFSDRLTFASTMVVLDTAHFDIAVAPQVTTFLRNESGVRLGGTVIGRLDRSGNSLGVTAGWSGASTASDTNPAGVWDFGAGYGRQLAQKGALSHLTPHSNMVLEKATGFQKSVALFGGVEYQITERVSVDASGQRFGLTGGGQDRQFLLSVTINLGKAKGEPITP